jgi:hypothetical protein
MFAVLIGVHYVLYEYKLIISSDGIPQTIVGTCHNSLDSDCEAPIEQMEAMQTVAAFLLHRAGNSIVSKDVYYSMINFGDQSNKIMPATTTLIRNHNLQLVASDNSCGFWVMLMAFYLALDFPVSDLGTNSMVARRRIYILAEGYNDPNTEGLTQRDFGRAFLKENITIQLRFYQHKGLKYVSVDKKGYSNDRIVNFI